MVTFFILCSRLAKSKFRVWSINVISLSNNRLSNPEKCHTRDDKRRTLKVCRTLKKLKEAISCRRVSNKKEYPNDTQKRLFLCIFRLFANVARPRLYFTHHAVFPHNNLIDNNWQCVYWSSDRNMLLIATINRPPLLICFQFSRSFLTSRSCSFMKTRYENLSGRNSYLYKILHVTPPKV